jgi:magnesium chelatase family protein
MSLSANSRSQARYEAFPVRYPALEAIKAGRQIIVANENASEVRVIGGSDCLIAGHLQEVCAFLEGRHELANPEKGEYSDETSKICSDVIGQEQGKRALEITLQVDTTCC